MPSTSKSQYRFWRMCANNPEFAESRGISKETAKEWHDADKKKKKDDPEWYENLPDKVEKDKPEHDVEESFEGFGDVLKRILGFPTPEEKAAADRMVAGLAQDSSKLNESMLKTGRIPLGNAGNLLHFKHWPNFRWTSDVENIVKDFGSWAIDFEKQRSRMVQQMKSTYDKASKMSDLKQAEAFVASEVAGIELKFDETAFHLSRKVMNFRHESDHKAGKYLVEQKPTWGAFDPTIPAPNIQEARKICDLMLKIGGLTKTILDSRSKEWLLVDIEEYQEWNDKFPNDEGLVNRTLAHFPHAGKFDKYDLGAVKIFTDMEKGLAEILLHSLTKKSVAAGAVESHEAKQGGLIHFLKALFGGGTAEDYQKSGVNPKTPEYNPKQLREYAAGLTAADLKTGTIEIASSAKKIGLHHWSPNWLNELDGLVKHLEHYLPDLFAKRKAYSLKVRDIYKKTESMAADATAAANWAVPLIKAEQDKFFRSVKQSNFNNWHVRIDVTPTSMLMASTHVAQVPSTASALEISGAKKVVELLNRLAKLRDDCFDADEDSWTLDDTDEWKWWDHHSPHNDDYHKFLNILPAAGEFPAMDLDGIDRALYQMELGLAGILTKSLSSEVVALEAKVPRAFRW